MNCACVMLKCVLVLVWVKCVRVCESVHAWVCESVHVCMWVSECQHVCVVATLQDNFLQVKEKNFQNLSKMTTIRPPWKIAKSRFILKLTFWGLSYKQFFFNKLTLMFSSSW